MSGEAPLSTYDFWAVGVNCCGAAADFKCGEFSNPKAHAGLRLMSDEQRPALCSSLVILLVGSC